MMPFFPLLVSSRSVGWPFGFRFPLIVVYSSAFMSGRVVSIPVSVLSVCLLCVVLSPLLGVIVISHALQQVRSEVCAA